MQERQEEQERFAKMPKHKHLDNRKKLIDYDGLQRERTYFPFLKPEDSQMEMIEALKRWGISFLTHPREVDPKLNRTWKSKLWSNLKAVGHPLVQLWPVGQLFFNWQTRAKLHPASFQSLLPDFYSHKPSHRHQYCSSFLQSNGILAGAGVKLQSVGVTQRVRQNIWGTDGCCLVRTLLQHCVFFVN